MISGGKLTNQGSLVMNAKGQVVGLVGQQMFVSYQMIMQRRPVTVPLRGQHWTDIFMPVEEFLGILDDIPSNPDQVRQLPWLGTLALEGVEKNLWVGYGLDSPGVRLHDVVPGYAADKAGLQENDIIVAVNDEPLELLPTADLTATEFSRDLAQHSVGEQVKVTFVRDGVGKETSVTLQAWPKRPQQAERYFDRNFGMYIREKVELDQYLDKSSAANVAGLIVLGVAANSPADKAGLRGGDLITTIAGQPVRTIEVYEQLVEKAMSSSATRSVDVLVRRGDEDKAISIRLD
jgi:serine protease Do